MLFCQHFWQTAPSKVDINFFSTPPKNNPDAKITGYKPKNNWALFQHYSVVVFFPWCPSIFYIMCGHLFFRLISDQPMGETQRVATVATTLKKPTPQNTSQLKINVSLSDFILIFRLECTYIHSMSIHPTLYKLLKCNHMNS